MPRKITYQFELESGTTRTYRLCFDDSHHYIPSPHCTSTRLWTKLEFSQCPHCTLKSAESPQCPVARNLDGVIEDFKETLSFTRAKVTVITPERTYIKECSLQTALRSVFGMLMASSGCPYLDWMRPLARFHLPFAEIDESLFRTLSVYLVESFLKESRSSFSDCAKEIEARYRDVEKLNQSFIGRINEYCRKDADKNALAALDVFVQMFSFHIENDFGALRKYFTSEQGS